MADVIADVSGVAAGGGLVFVAWQVYLARRQLTSSFEASFVDRYERIVANVPLEWLLGEALTPPSDQVERAMYDYFELCEEELYYRKSGRVSRSTWRDWWEGMRLHLRRPAFHDA